MNTRNNNEETQFDLGQNRVKQEGNPVSNAGKSTFESKKKNSSFAGKAAVGLGLGVLLGTASSFVMANAMPGDNFSDGSGDGNGHNSDAGTITDGSVEVASGVSDDMSFSEAFEAARSELGPGGAFEWHGNVYSTYTAEEWDNMAEEEKDDYFSHFNWSASADDEPADGEEDAGETADDVVAGEPVADEAAQDGSAPEETADGEVVSGEPVVSDTDPVMADVEPGEHVSDDQVSGDPVMAEDDVVVDDGSVQVDGSQETSAAADQINEDGVEILESTPEVEVLGVEHDMETGANYAGLVVDGQDVVLIDVDGSDNKYDYMAADLNNDGQITDDEISDISDQHIEVSQFENDLYANDQLYASSSDDLSTDYINDDDGCALV